MLDKCLVGFNRRSNEVMSQSMTAGLKVVLSAIPLLLLAAPSVSGEFTYKEYAKAPEPWRRGYVFGISHYVSAVAQPDEEPPYPVRDAFQRCLASATDGVLVRQVESYIASNPGSSKGPMVTVVVRALFDLCRPEIEKVRSNDPAPGRRSPAVADTDGF